MKRLIPAFLITLALLLTLGLAREAQAVPNCSATQCRADCMFACQSLPKPSTCVSSSIQCGSAECGPTPGTCNIVCASGPLPAGNCDCSGPPCTGSPIFRKQETKPAPVKKDKKQDSKESQQAKQDPQPAPESRAVSCPETP